MGNYKVKANETLVKIAKDNKFFTIEPILQANTEKWPQLATHHSVLAEGMTLIIPDKQAKKVDQATATSAVYTCKKKAEQHLSMKLYDPHGEIVSVANDVQLIINGSPVPITDQTNYDIEPVDYKIFATVNPLPDGAITSSSIKVNLTSVFSGQKIPTEIQINLGGLDPFVDPDAGHTGKPSDNKALKIAVQKILRNLGYYQGDLDGDLDKSASYHAISSFQSKEMQMATDDPDYGKPSVSTCTILSVSHGMPLGPITPIKYT
jgi:hypothetical protein